MTPPDQAVETKPNPVVGSRSGRLPNPEREEREEPPHFASFAVPRLASGGTRPGSTQSSCTGLAAWRAGLRWCVASPGGTRITACLLGGCLGNGLCLLGRLVCYSRTYGLPFEILTIRIPSHSHSCGAYAPYVSPALFAIQPPAPLCQQFP